MPLSFTLTNPASFAGAFLPASASLDSVIAGLPGLVGAWDAADYASGPWVPRIGSGGRIDFSTAPNPAPVLASRGGRPVISFNTLAKAVLRNPEGGTLGLTGLTYASRAYYSDVTTNFQKSFDLGAQDFLFRSSIATPYWQFTNLGDNGTTPIQLPLIDWHTVLFRKVGTTAARLSADGGAEVDISGSGTALSGQTLTIGDVGNIASAAQDISRVIICTSGDLTADQRAAVQVWING